MGIAMHSEHGVGTYLAEMFSCLKRGLYSKNGDPLLMCNAFVKDLCMMIEALPPCHQFRLFTGMLFHNLAEHSATWYTEPGHV